MDAGGRACDQTWTVPVQGLKKEGQPIWPDEVPLLPPKELPEELLLLRPPRLLFLRLLRVAEELEDARLLLDWGAPPC